LVKIYVDAKLSVMMQSYADSLRSKFYEESYTKNLERVKKGIIEGKLEIVEMENGYVTKVNERL
jgi:hypothetical protein